eukprot:m.123234 g.123234  ORF g.123234 m.123234 type:complete len:80 (-) comp11123_c0_seq13:1574-1813(-)
MLTHAVLYNILRAVESLKEAMKKAPSKHDEMWGALRSAKVATLPVGDAEAAPIFDEDLSSVPIQATAPMEADEDDLDEL